jgi:hypothetical protein
MATIKLIQEFEFSSQRMIYRIVDGGPQRVVYQTIYRDAQESKEEYDARAVMEFDSFDYKGRTTITTIKTREV